ncbi:hypothetical protein VPH35_025422 [Triticum aestivum]
MKPINILFNNDDTACVYDLGLARLIHGCSSGQKSGTTSIVGPRGSIGYIAPEYGMGSEISTEGDVYSYGIVLLEMLTHKRPTSDMGDQCVGHIPNLQEQNTFALKDICALRLLRLGLLCSAESPKDRPTMHDVYGEVTEVKEAFFSMDN